MAVERLLGAAVSALWIATAGAAPSAEQVIAPHRAVYDLGLKSAQPRSGIAGATGRMVLEVSGSKCDGWTVNFRIVNEFSLAAGDTRLVDSRSSSWEAGDGSTMRYSQRQYVNNRLESDVLITATRGGEEEPGKGEIEKPEKQGFTLAPSTIFPVAHQNRLIAAARRDLKRDESLVYDGSDGGNSFLAISFIGPRNEPAPLGPQVTGNGAEVLSRLAAWPVTISYFPTNGDTHGEETPSHQVSFTMYENGVAGDLTLDYGDFALDGTLKTVEMMEQPACDEVIAPTPQ
jgi:hypothetical protein